MPLIRKQDLWLVPLTIISLVLIAIGQIPVGVCLFVLSCLVIFRVYGRWRAIVHILLSGLVFMPLSLIIGV